MNTRYLFPNSFKKFGLVLLLLLFATWIIIDLNVFNLFPGIYVKLFALAGGDRHHFISKIDDIGKMFFIAGAILVSFSKEKNEDEFLSRIRLESLLWTIYIYYAIYLFFAIGNSIANVSQKDIPIDVELLLGIFLLRFYYIRYKHKFFDRFKKSVSNEK